MDIKKEYYKVTAEAIIKKMSQRNLQAYYVDNKHEAAQKVCSLIEDNASISWGGSMTLLEIGLLEKLAANPSYTLLDRSKVNPDQVSDLYHDALSCDYYLMSSNAVTLDGKLVNIDGTGNRVAALIYGPKNVIIVVGMNKIVFNEQEAISRVKNFASPLNALRLEKNTPCAKTGVCHDCLSPDCICMHTVITRNSREKDRIKVILVGENLGY
ncbi:lactate utilization protein [Cellulosilyticum sp. I15G10I2]|uniref:lactate utilization protein n=1 Tax=Cellulosilyticum sp. I15G10I2 TaxID=1892843 RepID=UPI00085C1161|nr:lactate utilization protein [Cellulosilyticum sp. I15G10I2]